MKQHPQPRGSAKMCGSDAYNHLALGRKELHQWRDAGSRLTQILKTRLLRIPRSSLGDDARTTGTRMRRSESVRYVSVMHASGSKARIAVPIWDDNLIVRHKMDFC